MVPVFYYLRPLYKDVGGNAMWAIMTVVVLENTVGKSSSESSATFHLSFPFMLNEPKICILGSKKLFDGQFLKVTVM